MYGHIEAARLFYNELNNSLTGRMNFERNTYDPCVYNKQTTSGVITIRTHVDDLKVSCKDRQEIQKVIEHFIDIYKEITVHEGDEHDYLGMIMTHDRDNGTVRINMEKYITGIINMFLDYEPDETIKVVTTPATNNLFKIRQCEDILLSPRRAGVFHATVAKLLFVAKRARPDILLAVSFLTTRVKTPDMDDWHKLIRVLGYLRGTMEYCLTITCADMSKLTWYVDGSYATHADMRGQSGAVLVTGNSAVLFRSNKQKINTRSSTKTELIAVNDVLPIIQWTTNFMKAQGYHLDTEIKEDNKSTMLLMKNGKLSSGKRTKHFDIRYFYIKDLIDRGIINLSHCISDDMIADFFTKPIQGKRFQILRDIVLNINSATVHRSVLVNINSTYALPQNSPSVTQTQTIQTIHSLDLTKIERGRDRDNS